MILHLLQGFNCLEIQAIRFTSFARHSLEKLDFIEHPSGCGSTAQALEDPHAGEGRGTDATTNRIVSFSLTKR